MPSISMLTIKGRKISLAASTRRSWRSHLAWADGPHPRAARGEPPRPPPATATGAIRGRRALCHAGAEGRRLGRPPPVAATAAPHQPSAAVTPVVRLIRWPSRPPLPLAAASATRSAPPPPFDLRGEDEVASTPPRLREELATAHRRRPPPLPPPPFHPRGEEEAAIPRAAHTMTRRRHREPATARCLLPPRRVAPHLAAQTWSLRADAAAALVDPWADHTPFSLPLVCLSSSRALDPSSAAWFGGSPATAPPPRNSHHSIRPHCALQPRDASFDLVMGRARTNKSFLAEVSHSPSFLPI